MLKLKWTRRKKRVLLALAALLVVSLYFFWNCLPEPLFSDPLSPVLFSREGHLLGARIAGDQQWRFPTAGKVPEKYKTSAIQFEDKRFYSHPGIDPLALARALVLNIKGGRKISGGSTISMQVIRLARKNRSRTYWEKLKEIILAVRLELRYSKQEIFHFYAANAPFGGNIVGLEAASRFYFGRSAGQLSWGESALLAVLPNSPSLIHPGRNRALLKAKRDRLLNKLREKKIIDTLEYSLALKEPLPGRPLPLPRLAPHLLDSLVKQSAVANQKKKGTVCQDAAPHPEMTKYAHLQWGSKGSLPLALGEPPEAFMAGQHRNVFFRSTLKRSVQERAVEVCRNHWERLKLKGIGNAAAIVIANRTGEVLAYVGNVGVGESGNNGQQVDIIHRPRSTGSILKPFLYAAMLKSGDIAPTTLVADIPTQYDGFIPDNFDRSYRGAVSAQEALARSLNIPAVRMLRKYGIHRFHHFLGKIGMTTLNRPADDYGLTLILGGAEGTLWEIASIYARLARAASGSPDTFSTISPLLKDASNREAGGELTGGSVLMNPCKKVESPGIGESYLTLEALLEVARPGFEGHWRTFSSSRKIAWKTGTSYGLRDAWAVGVTPEYTVGIWVGNADGEGKAGLTGIAVAAPVLFDIFNILDRGKWFDMPMADLKAVDLCKQSGYLASELCDVRIMYVPVESHFDALCPHHHLVHLDKSAAYRVDSRCESVENMQHRPWFTLPPVQEYYYRRRHPEYRTLPLYRKDCRSAGRESVMSLVYPSKGTSIYIPVDLDGKPGSAMFRAVHRTPDTAIFWHIDDRFIGRTSTFHQVTVNPAPGRHRLILMDEKGNRLERQFIVLGK
ncbi:MAG: penicillin-binding protein 1C [bacterium]|nr:penicillin-binding protein 1C [bacterium]